MLCGTPPSKASSTCRWTEDAPLSSPLCRLRAVGLDLGRSEHVDSYGYRRVGTSGTYGLRGLAGLGTELALGPRGGEQLFPQQTVIARQRARLEVLFGPQVPLRPFGHRDATHGRVNAFAAVAFAFALRQPTLRIYLAFEAPRVLSAVGCPIPRSPRLPPPVAALNRTY